MVRTVLLVVALAAFVGAFGTIGARAGVAQTFPDVPSDHWAYDAVDYLQEKGLVEGYPDGFFHGNRTLTRYEFAIVIARLYDKLRADFGEGTAPPPDVDAIYSRLQGEFHDEIADLKAMVDEHDQRIGEIETGVEDLTSRMEKTEKTIGDKLGSVKVSADLRTRIEIIDPDEDDKDETKRARIRLRVKGTGKVNDNVSATFRVSTSTDTAITSTNESLEDNYAFDPFIVDQAFLTYKPTSDTFLGKDWSVTAGKFTPNWMNSLITMDSDVNVEGLGWSFLTSDEHWRINLAQLQPQRAGVMLVNQVGYKDLFDWLDLYATYTHIDDKAFFRIQADAADPAKKLVNQLLLPEIADYSNFKQWEALATLDLADLFGQDYPLTLTGNYLESTYDPIPGMSERLNKAAYANLSGGALTDPGDWKWWLEWGRIQPNAVITLWTDSDRGEGNTEFWAASASYQWLKNLELAATFINHQRYFPSSSEEGFNRIQLDAIAKF